VFSLNHRHRRQMIETEIRSTYAAKYGEKKIIKCNYLSGYLKLHAEHYKLSLNLPYVPNKIGDGENVCSKSTVIFIALL